MCQEWHKSDRDGRARRASQISLRCWRYAMGSLASQQHVLCLFRDASTVTWWRMDQEGMTEAAGLQTDLRPYLHDHASAGASISLHRRGKCQQSWAPRGQAASSHASQHSCPLHGPHVQNACPDGLALPPEKQFAHGSHAMSRTAVRPGR